METVGINRLAVHSARFPLMSVDASSDQFPPGGSSPGTADLNNKTALVK